MAYQNDYDDDYYEEYADYADNINARRGVVRAGDQSTQGRRAVDLGVNGSIITIIILTLLYVISPVDFVPDIFPVAGQADDVAAVVAGGGSVAFLTVARYLFYFAMRSRVGRWGCLIVAALTAVGAFTVFWALLRLLNSVF
jgi:hypothetical protein